MAGIQTKLSRDTACRSFMSNISRSSRRALISSPAVRRGGGRSRLTFTAPVRAAADGAPDDFINYYELFGVEKDADKEEIKWAYYGAQKECHPDVSGELDSMDECILLNAAYEVLSDPEQRAKYDAQLSIVMMNEEEGFTGRPYSNWLGPESETQAVFVDEVSCIGCKQCIWEAEDTFVIDEEHGRSRAVNQWGNGEEELQNAIDCCPVDCIHWVEREQLPVLEHVMKDMQRVNVGIMMARQGGAGADPFTEAALFARRRAERAEEERKERARANEIFRTAAQGAAAKQAAENLRQKASKWGGFGFGGFGRGANKKAQNQTAQRKQGKQSSGSGDKLVPAALQEDDDWDS